MEMCLAGAGLGYYDPGAEWRGRLFDLGLFFFEELSVLKKIIVQVREDHLETLARTKPMTAMAELIWNALDAEATEVRVEFVLNALDGVEMVRIVDNGTGLEYEEAVASFGSLGGSWKRERGRSGARRRVFHGKYGKGRFRAFSMGNRVVWRSVYAAAGTVMSFAMSGRAAALGEFEVSAPVAQGGRGTGMTVEITDLYAVSGLLQGVKAQEEVTAIFALYLREYPDVRLVYDGVPVDAGNAEERSAEYGLAPMVMENGERVEASLRVVEWRLPGKRGVYLCDEKGFMLHKVLPRLYFRGFSYSAYLKSAHIERLDREGLLAAGELSGDLRQLLEAVRAKLREHFGLREAQRGQDVLAVWKAQGVYPYAGEARDGAEFNERRIFDIYSTHLNQILPDFASSGVSNKRLTLKLIQELVRSEPARVARVLDALLDFPEEKQEEILALAQR